MRREGESTHGEALVVHVRCAPLSPHRHGETRLGVPRGPHSAHQRAGEGGDGIEGVAASNGATAGGEGGGGDGSELDDDRDDGGHAVKQRDEGVEWTARRHGAMRVSRASEGVAVDGLQVDGEQSNPIQSSTQLVAS